MYGNVIDSTCIYWSEQCGYHGNCLLYDLVSFRYKYVGMSSVWSPFIILTVLVEASPPPLPTLGHIWDVILLWRKRNIEKKLSLCYGIVYHYNGAQRYEQFLQVGWLYQALILFGLALSSKCLCVLDLHGATSKICLNPTLYLLVSWAWWDWLLMWLTNHCPSVLWHCWLGHVTRKIVSEMTYNVSSGTLKPTIPYHWLGQWCLLAAPDQLSISAGNACPQWAYEMATMVGSLA